MLTVSRLMLTICWACALNAAASSRAGAMRIRRGKTRVIGEVLSWDGGVACMQPVVHIRCEKFLRLGLFLVLALCVEGQPVAQRIGQPHFLRTPRRLFQAGPRMLVLLGKQLLLIRR